MIFFGYNSLSVHRDLMSWINGIRGLVSSEELAKDVTGAEALLERHQVLNSSLWFLNKIANILEVFPPSNTANLFFFFFHLSRNTAQRLMLVLVPSRPLNSLVSSCWCEATMLVLRFSRNWRL